jgi:hypothetical protein
MGANCPFLHKHVVLFAYSSLLLDSHLIVRGPDLMITAAAAQAIGIHELATNAGKYGRFDRCGPRRAAALHDGMERVY